MDQCCQSTATAKKAITTCCDHGHEGHPRGFDYILWGSLTCVFVGIAFYVGETLGTPAQFVSIYSHSVVELLSRMWWGLILGIFFSGVLGQVPREVIIAAFGRSNGFSGLVRATAAGVVLDLCNHGILFIGMKLYERGATLGQTMAFLIASPWNSFSLTIILASLIGLPWTLAFVACSAVIALLTGWLFERLVANGTLPQNPYRNVTTSELSLFQEIRQRFSLSSLTPHFFLKCGRHGLAESRMIIRWLFLGIVLASFIRALVPDESFQALFGPTMLGLLLTLLATTVIEVCSEGSTPIAADIFTRAASPGNAFTFLMAGVSTDYTELMALKETTKRWKIAIFLPLLTIPQILFIGWIMNTLSTLK
jgi:uncharacterized protein